MINFSMHSKLGPKNLRKVKNVALAAIFRPFGGHAGQNTQTRPKCVERPSSLRQRSLGPRHRPQPPTILGTKRTQARSGFRPMPRICKSQFDKRLLYQILKFSVRYFFSFGTKLSFGTNFFFRYEIVFRYELFLSVPKFS